MSKTFLVSYLFNTLLHIYEIVISSLSIIDLLCTTLPKVLFCTICLCKNSFVLSANAKLFPIGEMWLTIKRLCWCILITWVALLCKAESAFLWNANLLFCPLTHYYLYIYSSHAKLIQYRVNTKLLILQSILIENDL